MEWRERIVTDVDTCGGRPRVRGARISVKFKLGPNAAVWSDERILENYTHLIREDLRAAIAYAYSILEDENFVSITRAV